MLSVYSTVSYKRFIIIFETKFFDKCIKLKCFDRNNKAAFIHKYNPFFNRKSINIFENIV